MTELLKLTLRLGVISGLIFSLGMPPAAALRPQYGSARVQSGLEAALKDPQAALQRLIDKANDFLSSDQPTAGLETKDVSGSDTSAWDDAFQSADPVEWPLHQHRRISSGLINLRDRLRVSGSSHKPFDFSTSIMLEAMERLPIFKGEDIDVLDVGTGPGTLLLAALDQLGAGRGVGTEPEDGQSADFSDARHNAQKLGLTDRLEFRQGSLLEPAQEDRFDVVLFNPVDSNLAEQFVSGVGDVLEPDGVALFGMVRQYREIDRQQILHDRAKSAGLYLVPLLQVSEDAHWYYRTWSIYAVTRTPERLTQIQDLLLGVNLMVGRDGNVIPNFKRSRDPGIFQSVDDFLEVQIRKDGLKIGAGKDAHYFSLNDTLESSEQGPKNYLSVHWRSQLGNQYRDSLLRDERLSSSETPGFVTGIAYHTQSNERVLTLRIVPESWNMEPAELRIPFRGEDGAESFIVRFVRDQRGVGDNAPPAGLESSGRPDDFDIQPGSRAAWEHLARRDTQRGEVITSTTWLSPNDVAYIPSGVLGFRPDQKYQAGHQGNVRLVGRHVVNIDRKDLTEGEWRIEFNVHLEDDFPGKPSGLETSRDVFWRAIASGLPLEAARKLAKEASWASAIGAQKVRKRLEAGLVEVSTQPPREDDGPTERKYPGFEFDKREWVRFVRNNAGELFEKGIVRREMGDGELILLLRGGRSGSAVDPENVHPLFIDLLVKPLRDQREHLHLGRFDLDFQLLEGYFVPAYAKDYPLDYFDRLEARAYLTDNNIEQTGRLSMFTMAQSADMQEGSLFQALYVNRDSLYHLGMPKEEIQAALALAAAEVIHYRFPDRKFFGVDLRSEENAAYFGRLEASRVEVDFESEATFYSFPAIRRAFRDKLLGKVEIDPQTWAGGLVPQIGGLLTRGLVEMPISGGAITLLCRSNSEHAWIDAMIQRSGEAPSFLGRIDLTHQSGEGYILEEAHILDNPLFIREAATYLERHDIPTGTQSDFWKSRYDHQAQALYVAQGPLDEFGLSRNVVQDALLLSAVGLLQHANIGRFSVNLDHNNQNIGFGRFAIADRNHSGNVLTYDVPAAVETVQRHLVGYTMGFDPEKWFEYVRDGIYNLKREGMLLIPASRSDLLMVLRYRQHDRILMDMFLRPDTFSRLYYLGRLDLNYDGRVNQTGTWLLDQTARSVAFEDDVYQYLKSKSVDTSGENSPFEKYRYDTGHFSRALWVDPNVGDLGAFSKKATEAAMLWAAAALVEDIRDYRIGMDRRYGYHNIADHLGEVSYETDNWVSPEIQLYDSMDMVTQLRHRVHKLASAGLETGGASERAAPVSVPPGFTSRMEVQKRVTKALKNLPSSWFVKAAAAGPEVEKKYPGLNILGRLLPAFQVDPGGEGTLFAVELLKAENPDLEAVIYYGGLLAHNHFSQIADERGISAGEEPIWPGSAHFDRYLKKLFTLLTQYPAWQIVEQMGMTFEQLADDLELLATGL